ncbi:ribose 5-phosphate isomerase A [Acrasis kona]|uniref:ribose-5-phosphate isomerase n=1 Tax=Acrasis kona TaxID=1008807 RepID=A0AAW2Z779_9EUKA
MEEQDAKRIAGYAAVDEFVKNNQVVGIGAGSTVPFCVERIKQRVDEEGLSLVCIPSGYQAKQLILDHGLILSDLSQHPDIDVAIDGADEIDKDLNLIKGGGGCQLQEKILASCAKLLIIVADFHKESQNLGEYWKRGVPVEVIPMAVVPVMNKVKKLGGNPVIRFGVMKAGPVVTDNGNLVVDVDFGIIQNPNELNEQLTRIPGVVETGLFIGMADKVFIGQADGGLHTIVRK